MGGNKYSELILEAIDQLRKRKARPDLERICHMLERRHGLKSSEVNEQLADMVDRGVVMKVDYKGNTSYRNAAKWVRTKSLFKPDFTSSDMAIAVQEAVHAISCPGEPGNSTVRCASLHDIEKYLLKRETMCNMNIATLRSTLEREVANGNIRQVRTGEYVSISQSSNNNPTKSSEKSSRVSDDIDDKSHLVRKRFKVNAESINIPKDSKEEISCDYCLLTPGSNRTGEPEGLLVCKDCDVKAHPSCVDYSGEVAKMVMLSTWQCPDCKICAVCSECGDEDDMVICGECDKGYHITCHKPPLPVKPKVLTSWTCINCLNDDFWKPDGPSHVENTSSLNVDTSASSHAQVSKEEGTAFVFQKCLENYPDVVPLVDEWTIEEVQMFLKRIGFHDEASAFKEQEIDGQSLLLMKRSDVLTGLSIKLGPALKIYSHIKRLQNVKTSDEIINSCTEIWCSYIW